MSEKLERMQLENAVQQRYGQIIGIEQASDDHLRQCLALGERLIVHHYRESKSAPGLLDWLFK